MTVHCIVISHNLHAHRAETDHEQFFRQESSFNWAFGVKEPDCCGMIHLRTGKSVVFIPRLPESYAVWMGLIRDAASFKAEYAVDEVRYVDEIVSYLDSYQPVKPYTWRVSHLFSHTVFLYMPLYRGVCTHKKA